LHSNIYNISYMSKDINRLKVVLAEKKRTNKWLAEQLGKDPGTVSKWCTNTMQPNLETLVEIAKALEVDVKDLLWSIKTDKTIGY
jgi:DNA-binding Xre family transcriptional regulator